MREVVIDTETTGLSPDKGHRLVEISAVELIHRAPTGRKYHAYVNPKRSMPEEAFRVHGLSEEFLKDFPTFEKVKDDFLAFLGFQDTLVIHNAEFDLGFINAELKWANHPNLIDKARIVDTLTMARKRFPGAPNNLDALCKRFNISLSKREKHGALIDAQLLAEVYVELLGGRQQRLVLGEWEVEDNYAHGVDLQPVAPAFPRRASLIGLTEEEKQAHDMLLKTLSGSALWNAREQ